MGSTASGRHSGDVGKKPKNPFAKENTVWIRKGLSGWKRRKEMDDLRMKALGGAKMSPLEFALSLMNDDEAPLKTRMWACSTAMPYCHARIVQIQGDEKKPLVVATAKSLQQLPDEELNVLMRTLGKLNSQIAAQIDEDDFKDEQKLLPYNNVEDAVIISETKRPKKKSGKPKIR